MVDLTYPGRPEPMMVFKSKMGFLQKHNVSAKPLQMGKNPGSFNRIAHTSYIPSEKTNWLARIRIQINIRRTHLE